MSEWICHARGVRYGQHNSISTYHQGLCAWCGEDRPVTESRDYGYPERQADTIEKGGRDV